MHEHLIFYDEKCPLCCRAVKGIIEIDVDQCFRFAPLEGSTADDVLIGPQRGLRGANSLVLVENYQSTERVFWVRSQAVLRTYWLVGHGWGLIGIFSFLPGFLGDALYRWLAAHRHQFKLKREEELGPKDRFLP